MQYTNGKRVRIIAAAGAEEFQEKLNKELEALDKSKAKYELTFNREVGYCAYLVIEKVNLIPETVADEFELAGESHNCLECPFWQHPTKGNVKYTRCEITPGLHGAKSPACDRFYELLAEGQIELEEE